MLKRIVYGSFLMSIVYFVSYFFFSGLRELVIRGGFWAALHATMSFILIIGIFSIVLLILRYLFVDPNQNQKK